jgi:hypothetical protein
MGVPLRIAADPALAESLHGLERSVRVGTAAAMLDADPSHVRKLLKSGDLEGHTLGKRGVRIFVASIEAYRERGRIATGQRAPVPRPKRQAPPSVEHLEALAFLQQAGLLAQPAPTSNGARGRRK